MDFGVRARDGIAFLIHKAQVGVGLAVHLDAAGHAVVHVVGVLDKGLEYLFSAITHGVLPPAYSSILKDFVPFLVRWMCLVTVFSPAWMVRSYSP